MKTLEKHGEKNFAKKNLGQHFLKDQSIIQKIIQSIDPNLIENIVEVGPGPGALTNELKMIKKPMTIIERDDRFVTKWLEFKNEDFQIVAEDALAVNYHQLINQKKTWLVSNLPYNISTPLTRIFLEIPSIHYMTLMYQKEVAERIVGRGGMNSLHFLLSSHFKLTWVTTVKPGAFHPPPKVDSAVILFERLENPLFPLSILDSVELFSRKLFSMPRKQIKNATPEVFKSGKFNHLAQLRAEKLCANNVLELYYA